MRRAAAVVAFTTLSGFQLGYDLCVISSALDHIASEVRVHHVCMHYFKLSTHNQLFVHLFVYLFVRFRSNNDNNKKKHCWL